MRWISRYDMPQIDEADLTALIEWLTWKGVTVSAVTLSSKLLRFRQAVTGKFLHMSEQTYRKPILVSSDYYVLDGNHRAKAHVLRNEDCNALLLSCTFNEALKALFSFAGTYQLTPTTPIRN